MEVLIIFSSIESKATNKDLLKPKSGKADSQLQQMQPTTSGTSSNIGSGGPSRGGLTRFRSAPATWLEALLEEEEQEEEDLFKTDQCLTQLLTENSASSSSRNPVSFASSVDPSVFETVPSSGFFRQNSSPAEFLGNSAVSSQGLFSNYDLQQDFDYTSDDVVVSPSSKRLREAESRLTSMKHQSQLKVEPGVEVAGAGPSLVDKEMEKVLEGSVPCKVRAKRGCATHPRSIAERVRRTRISDRIRKLQELVPNLDKQTNTADMLDEAVAYVKFLQQQIEELSEHQRKCKCVLNDEIAAK